METNEEIRIYFTHPKYSSIYIQFPKYGEKGNYTLWDGSLGKGWYSLQECMNYKDETYPEHVLEKVKIINVKNYEFSNKK